MMILAHDVGCAFRKPLPSPDAEGSGDAVTISVMRAE